MHAVFTYGSLMFAPVWSKVVSGHYASQAATLHGYRRLALHGEDYPAALPAAQHSIQGLLYLAVTDADLMRLDAFEGEYYQRITAPVVLEHGAIHHAFCYLLKADYAYLSTGSDWDVQAFATAGMQRFLTDYAGFA